MAGAETTSAHTEGKTDGICTREVTSNRKTEDTVLKTRGGGWGWGWEQQEGMDHRMVSVEV